MPDDTILVPEPSEAFQFSLGARWTRRNIVSGDETWTEVFGSASRAETVTTTSGDATIAGAAGTFDEWDSGAPVTGTGIPANTVIASVTSDTSAEMSANATNSGSISAAIGLHGVYLSLAAGEAYLTDCPAGDFEIIAVASRTIPISSRMLGPMIVDGSGNGVMGSWYDSPNTYLTLKVTTYGYGSSFTQGSGAMPAATTAVKLRKSGNDYYTSYSTNYGSSWSSETPALTNATFTPTKMGFGSILGANQSVKLHEFYPGLAGDDIALGVVSETTTVNAITAVAGATVALGVATESTTVHAIAATQAHTIALGLVTETTTVHAASVLVGTAVALGVVSETTTVHALGVVADVSVALGVVSETTTVHAISAISPDVVALGLVTETTTVYSITITESVIRTANDYVDGRGRDGIAYGAFEPHVTPTPAELLAGADEVVVQAFGAVTMQGTQPTHTTTEVRVKRYRHQYVSAGRDITYPRGVATPRVSYQLVEPLLYNTGTLTLPQFLAWAEPAGVGDLDWFYPDAPFKINAVDPDTDTSQGVIYKGWIKSLDPAGDLYTAQLDGEILGRATDRWRPQPIFRSKADIGLLFVRGIRTLGGRTTSRTGPVTKIKQYRTGGSNFAHYLLSLFGLAQDRRGRQWTSMPDETGAYDVYRKDTTTIDGTVYLTGDNGLCPYSLRRDLGSEYNRAFATGLTPEGERILFGIYPGFTQIKNPVPYPGSPVGLGDTGDATLAVIRRLIIFNYLTLDEYPGGFDEDVEEAVERFQRRLMLPVTGVVNEATWDRLFDVDSFRPTLVGSQVMPAAAEPYTQEFIRRANGTIIGHNPVYDPHRRAVDAFHDWGAGFRRDRIQDYEEEQLHTDEPNWVGSITIRGGGIIAGEHNPGDPLTADDILRAEFIRPGMNLWLPQFQGGIKVRVGIVDARNDGTYELSVDTRNRDALHLSAIKQRNREVLIDPAASFWKQIKTGHQKEALGEFSEQGGYVDERVDLDAGWNIVPIIAGESGTIRTIEFDTNPAAESAVAVFGEYVWPNVLDREIGDPLTEEGTENWSNEGVLRRLRRDHGFLYQAGGFDSRGGYGAKPSGDAAILTGEFMDHAGVPYYTRRLPVLYLAIWVDRATRLVPGRVVLPNMEPV